MSPTVLLDQLRVNICTPCDDRVHTAFCMSLVHMVKWTILQQPSNLQCLSVQSYSTSMLPWARQQLAKVGLEQGATHLLWIDSDMQFPQDMLLRFLSRSQPIIGINAMSRRQPYRTTAQHAEMKPVNTKLESSGLEKVERCGFGVVWMATEVLRAIKMPWFDFEWVTEKNCYRGEDYYFFEKVKEAGYEIFIDHDLSKEIFHIGSFGFNPLMVEIMERGKA